MQGKGGRTGEEVSHRLRPGKTAQACRGKACPDTARHGVDEHPPFPLFKIRLEGEFAPEPDPFFLKGAFDMASQKV